jgi:hypothetical protein
MGIAVKMATKAIPTVRAVVVDGPAALAAVVDTFEVSAPQSEVAAMLAEIAEAVASRAEGLGVNGAIIRRADKSQRPSNQEGPRVRLLTEGAITAAVRAHVPETVIRDGEHCGTLYGPDKTAMDAAARSLLAGAAREVKYDEAAGAALAALSL